MATAGMRVKIGRGTIDDEETIGYLTLGADGKLKIEGDKTAMASVLRLKRAGQSDEAFLAELPQRLHQPHLWAARVR